MYKMSFINLITFLFNIIYYTVISLKILSCYHNKLKTTVYTMLATIFKKKKKTLDNYVRMYDELLTIF